MSKEKQIEEMEMTPLDFLANDIYQHCPDLKENYCGDSHCVSCLANALYNAGYRKQSEGYWTLKRPNCSYYCSCCGKGIKIKYGERAAILWDYCPNCGARMKGGEGK